MPHVRAGRLKALAIASRQPSPLAPEVPTMSASGLPGYEAASISGMFAPAKTPRAIIDLINGHIMRTLQRDDVKERFAQAGIDAVGSTPDAFTQVIRVDIAKWHKVIREAGIHEDKGR
jgi:tripartite-type tricarboxylate transporter receptor subunit TctC